MSEFDVLIHKVNETFLRLETTEATARHIFKSFRFTNNKLKYHPRVKARLWDGYINLFNIYSYQIYIGLLEELVQFFKDNDYSYAFSFKKENAFHEDIFQQTLSLVEDKFEFFEHQLSAIKFALKTNRGLIVSATGSGKSLIMYVIAMYYLLQGQQKVLIIVPRTQLVEQISDAFIEYHKGDKKAFRDTFELIYSGTTRNPNASIVISTWQSLSNNPQSSFAKYDVVLFDEAHLVTAKCLVSIMENCTNTKYKFGFTGTLTNKSADTDIDEFVLKGLFGKVEVVSTNRELMDKDILTKVVVNAVHLNYKDKDLCKRIMNGSPEVKAIKDHVLKRKKLFVDEINYMFSSEIRNDLLVKIALSRKGNTLMMFQLVEKHGKILYDLLKEAVKSVGKEVFYIHGKISVTERELIRMLIESQDNIIVVSSYGTTSTGIDYKNISNIIFASGFKSKITTLQTIGRGLRKHINKDFLNVYDLGDDFSLGKKTKNFLFSHFLERVSIYREEKFPIKLIEYDIINNEIKRV